ncbi:ImmA/IrrE family metallo-endopeptidase [Cerasicoccus maritimus]|uniref:ImmA/IrrE family metallo-endopeptidase n=1 Tax=Cerasicoccus maritimus TaxID=490089 RepID=UPI00285269B7|nr:ImmA/IrrE family metallo-endopeptidase [Cerasicoccus maritimus]
MHPTNKANRIKAQGAAFRLWKELGVPHPCEVPLEHLAASRNAFVQEGAMKGAEGRLIRKSGRGIIRACPNRNFPGRRRFTIAHELGHWELHDGQSQFLCSDEDMRYYGRSPMEVEANHFAAELLMPTGYFREACGNSFPSIALIAELSTQFQTTLTATAIRYADVSRHRVIIVWFCEGIVKWCYSKETHHLPYVVAGREPPQYSSATLKPDEVADEMQHYDDANWFPELPYAPEVLEETKRMPNLNAGLTLLYAP